MEVTLDYETRSTVDLKKSGAIEYAKHHSTSIFCVAYRIGDGTTQLWIPERGPMPYDLWWVFKHSVLVAHNAGFEQAITRYTLVRYMTLTPEQVEFLANIPASRWRCTAAKAAYSSLPRGLEGAGAALGLTVQKDKEGNRLVKKFSKPRKPSKHNPKLWWDNKNELRHIYRYCIQDVSAECELDESIPNLSKDEQSIWELNELINSRGVCIDTKTVRIILRLVAREMKNIDAAVWKLSDGAIDRASQRDRVLKWVNKHGAEMEDLRAATIRDKLEEKGLDFKVQKMLQFREWSSRTSTGKFTSMLASIGDDNIARDLLLYGGGVPTMRFAGKRIQPQNFPRGKLKFADVEKIIAFMNAHSEQETLEYIRAEYGPPMTIFPSLTRAMLIPKPGNEFFCADWSGIEARLGFWVAEHSDGIAAFRDGRPLYEEMAVEIFGIDIKKVTKDSLERFIGKETILGAQYGMGWKKFLTRCHQLGRKEVTEEIAQRAISAYRKKHALIPRLWRNLEQAVMSAIKQPGERFTTNKVAIWVQGDFLLIKLPSGRRMRYFKPRIRAKQLESGLVVPEIRYMAMEHHVWKETSIWGGILANHVIQGIARDVMVNSMREVDRVGYQTVLSAHDEGLAERKIGEGQLAHYVKAFSTIPAWAAGCPLRAEGWTGMRYRKS